MSFIQREIDRIRPLLVANPDQPELYAAQQALCWALEPSGVKSPYEMITCSGAEPEGCSAPSHPTQSSDTFDGVTANRAEQCPS
jgi:hypothetical protein